MPVLTQLNSRHQCFLHFNFPLKTGCVVFGKQFIVKKHNSFKSGLPDVPSSENACISNFFRLQKIYIYKEQLINQKTSLVGRVTSRFDKALLVRTKITRPIPSDECEVTPLLWLMTYVIYVNPILDSNARVINKKYLHFFFNFHSSFHRYKYPNWLAWQGEMFLLLFLCLRRSVEFKVISNGGWTVWESVRKTDLFNYSNYQLISTQKQNVAFCYVS